MVCTVNSIEYCFTRIIFFFNRFTLLCRASENLPKWLDKLAYCWIFFRKKRSRQNWENKKGLVWELWRKLIMRHTPFKFDEEWMAHPISYNVSNGVVKIPSFLLYRFFDHFRPNDCAGVPFFKPKRKWKQSELLLKLKGDDRILLWFTSWWRYYCIAYQDSTFLVYRRTVAFS